MLHDALDLCTGPAALRWAKTPAREVADHEVGHGLSARQARHGGDVCLVGVGKMLGTWNGQGQHQAVVDRLRDQLAPVCANLPPADAQKATCESVLKKA